MKNLGGSDSMPHFVLVPLLAPGHMIPMVDMARLLAARGATVTFVITPLNEARIKSTIDRIKQANLPIHFLSLRFPCAEAGLPEGCENGDIIPSSDLAKNFFAASALMLQPLLLHLHQQPHPPNCVISDRCQPWTRHIAAEFHIPRFAFHGEGCFALLCSYNIQLHRILEDRDASNTDAFVIPEIPHHIEIIRSQAPTFLNSPDMKEMQAEVREAEEAADGVVVNSFDDLEPTYRNRYEKATGKKVWTIGPMCDVTDITSRGNKASVNEHECLSWLDGKKPSSVVYVSFGSMACTALAQLIEIGLGLEATGRPFIWVTKAGDRSPEVEQWLKTDGYEERVRGRGMIISGWAPQVMILSHPAVGGFVTHCGWNSTLEGIMSGVPMATWPHFADQFLNEKLVVEVLGIGVAVGVTSATEWAEEHCEAAVGREAVEKAVMKLMDGGEDGEVRRQKVAEMQRKAREAVEEGGSSSLNLGQMLMYVSSKKI